LHCRQYGADPRSKKPCATIKGRVDGRWEGEGGGGRCFRKKQEAEECLSWRTAVGLKKESERRTRPSDVKRQSP